MHDKYRRRRLRAERDFVHKRQTTPSFDPGDGVASDPGDGDSDPDDDFSTPITLTVIETIAVATSASSTQMTTLTSLSTMSSIISTTTTQTITVSTATTTATSSTTTSSTTTLATSSSSTSTFAQIPSVLPPSATLSTNSSTSHKGNSSEAQGSLSTSSTSLSGGGIAGIVIGLLFLVAAVLIFFMRKRFIQRRKRLTGAWTRRSGIINPSSFGASNEPKIEPFPLFRQGESKSGPISNVTPPPMAMNSPSTPYANSPITSYNQYPSTGGGAPSTAQSPLNLSPFLATVVCTFIITLPDELSIAIGEKMRVLAEYDDGWALCMRTNGEQGMVPLECLDQSRTSTNSTFGLPADSRGSRRISSLDINGAGPRVARSRVDRV